MGRKVALITGPTSGTGKYLALHMGRMGYDLILVGRDLDKRFDASQVFPGNSNKIYKYEADLFDLNAVKNITIEIQNNHPVIQVFVANAGILGEEQFSSNDQGIEKTFMINYLSHFVLQGHLLPCLKRGTGIIFNICSTSHRWYAIDFSDLQSKKNYQPMKAYARSKAMLLMLGIWVSHNFKKEEITVYNIDPGIFRSGISRSRGLWFRWLYAIGKIGMKSPQIAIGDVVQILNGNQKDIPSGAYIKKGKLKKVKYSNDIIGDLMRLSSEISGFSIDDSISATK